MIGELQELKKIVINKNCENSEVYFNDNGKDNILDSVNKITKIYPLAYQNSKSCLNLRRFTSKVIDLRM